jgi:RNA polymerase sigma factor (sigma-70 family)
MAKRAAKKSVKPSTRAMRAGVKPIATETSAESAISRELLLDYQAGASEAADEIFHRYVERMLALARSRMSSKLRRRVDPDDVVQSAYRSFFLHARNEEYVLKRAGDLWRLLASITLHKLYKQAERHTAARRSVAREIAEDERLALLASLEPTPAQAVALAEQLHLATASLTDAERGVIIAHLQGDTAETIATRLGKSPRTVRRLLSQARAKLEGQILGGEPQKKSVPVASAEAPLRYEDYVLEQLLGSGGMGKVYRARHRHTGEAVALKALHKTWQHEKRAVERLVQESQILADLRHPHIVGVRGLGRFPGGGYFLVMDLVTGGDLATRLKQGPLPVTEAIRIVSEVASAIGFAHRAGVIHCDLKPANVVLDESGHSLVTDFGFAYAITPRSHMAPSSIGGSVGYMAPEIARGITGPTPAADIYGLGALLWTLVTGVTPRQPFDVTAASNSPELALLAPLVRDCTDPDPSSRFATTEALITALRETLAKHR